MDEPASAKGASLTEAQEQREAASAKEDKTVSHRQVIESCINCLLLVALKDGRLIEGRLDCYDKQGNMILINASDVTRETDRPFGASFRLGTVMVPGGVTSQVLLHTQKGVDAEKSHPQPLPNFAVAAAGNVNDASQRLGALLAAKGSGEEQGEQPSKQSSSAK